MASSYYVPPTFSGSYTPPDPASFAGTVAPEYSEANQNAALGSYAQSLNPYYQNAYRQLGSRFAGSTLASGSAPRYGMSALEQQRTGQIAGQKSTLQTQGMAANMQERQFQQSQGTLQQQFKANYDLAVQQFREQTKQFSAELNQKNDMSEEEKKQWWAKFQSEQATQAAQLGIQQAELTGYYDAGTYKAGYTDTSGNYVPASYTAGTGPGKRTLAGQAADWTKFSGLASMIRSGALASGSDYGFGATDTMPGLSSIKPEGWESSSQATKFGFTNAWEMTQAQSLYPEQYKNLYSAMQKHPTGGSSMSWIPGNPGTVAVRPINWATAQAGYVWA